MYRMLYCWVFEVEKSSLDFVNLNIFRDDALERNTRSHSEHDGEGSGGRWYLAGNGPGE